MVKDISLPKSCVFVCVPAASQREREKRALTQTKVIYAVKYRHE